MPQQQHIITVDLEQYKGQPLACVRRRWFRSDIAVGKFGERWNIKVGYWIAHCGPYAIGVWKEMPRREIPAGMEVVE